MALVQTTTKSPVASEAVPMAGGATAPATRLVFTTNSGASGVWLSSRRSSSASMLGRLRKILSHRGWRFIADSFTLQMQVGVLARCALSSILGGGSRSSNTTGEYNFLRFSDYPDRLITLWWPLGTTCFVCEGYNRWS